MAGSAHVNQRIEDRPPPGLSIGPLAWLRANLFNSWFNAILTLLILWLLITMVPPILDWVLFSAIFADVPSEVCRGADGACWAFVREKFRLIMLGLYPQSQQWRPIVAVVLFIALIGASANRRFWTPWLAVVWVAGLVVVFTLMYGGVLGLTVVPTARWGGLPLTLGLSVIGLVVAFPLSILLALGRRSEMPAIKTICVVYIELIRGVPLITVLFMSSALFPLFLPTGVNFDKLLRAQVAMILFAAAYLAEVVRGGLQAVPKGQYEAADSLGLGYWQKTMLIVLPQALRISIPPLVNTFIGFFKDTSLVVIIGLFDLLGATKAALTDPAWLGFYKEAYLFVGVIYFMFCFTMSRYSQALEKRVNIGTRR
ncbi:MAG: amino acid ABC transporter permease [Inquilinaceae bacterium]